MTPPLLLEKIDTPHDLGSLSIKELKSLAQEMRDKIIDVLSVNGGHLSSNLGIIELSIALHYVFNSPVDKFLFDVSHQTYPHKLLTGRLQEFSTVRKYKGLCGFSHPKESPHDHFYAGHAGTALPLALGMAKNRDLAKRDEHVIPILGDAAFTCGLTLEALNNIPKDLKSFITVLNDNQMSISKNVGNIKNILSRLFSNPTTNKLHHELQALVSRVPGYGPLLAKQGQKLSESLKNLVSPAPFFEQFGLSYIGPIDGHDIKKLIDTFQALKNVSNPVIVHVMTVKGKGMPAAIEDPTIYHGVKPFDVCSGKFHPSPSTKPTFPKVFGKHLLKMAENDPSLIAITPAMPAGSQLTEMMKQFPDRCIDVGIAEGHAVSYAGGIAYGKKMKVVVSIYATFLQRALDNLYHDICIQELPVVFAIDRSGLAGADGITHNGIYDIGFLNAMPNMVITQPRNGQLLKELLESSFSWERPVAIRYPNLSTEEAKEPLQKREMGKGEILHLGKDLVILTLGHKYETALEIQELLKPEGINPTIVDPIFLKPLDTDLLCSLFSSHRYVVTIEEHSLQGGLGSIINSFILRNGFNHLQVLNFAVPDTFVQHGSHKELTKELGLDATSIVQNIFKYLEPLAMAKK